MRYRHISVDGSIGAGKTTLVKKLAEEFGGTAVFEPAEKNPFLGDFYKNRKRHAFTTQLFFMLSRFRQQEELKQLGLFEKGPVICDYTFIKDRIFAEINLNPDEKKLYDVVFNLLMERLPMPDLIIYLRADPKVLMQRIGKRGISYEKGIDTAYLSELTNMYDSYYLNYNSSPLLVVDTTMINYERKPADFDLLKKEIINHRGGVVHVVAK
jgi:deoxyguanosine kinase